MLKVPSEELPDRVGKMIDRLKQAEKQISAARTSALTSNIESLIGEPVVVGDTSLFRFTAPTGTSANELRDLVMNAKSSIKANNYVLVAAALETDKVAFVVTTDAAARESKISAANVLKAMLPAVSGRGGGSPEMSQGGGSDLQGLDAAFKAAIDGLGT
jgi:alanyl-tRNA synthetase